MSVILPVVWILMDACGVVCMTALVRALWLCPERNRICTVITGVAVAAASVSVAVYAAVNIPEDLTPEMLGVCVEPYERYLALTDLQSFVSGCLLLFAPMLFLRVKHVFRTFLLELTFYFAVESLFSVVATVLDLNADTPEKLAAEAVYGIVAYTALAIVFFSSMKRERQLPLRAVVDRMPRWLFVAAIIFSFTAYCKTGLFDGPADGEYAAKVFDVLWMLSTAGIMISAAYFVYKIFLLSYQQNQIVKQMNEQQIHYEQMLKTDEQLRVFRHDYKNHMMVVTALLNNGRTEEAADYLEKVKVASGVAGRQFSTGSFIADAILNNKNSLAEEFAVHLGFTGRLPAEGVENSDFCTVFANLLDNAIEGARKYHGNRYVNIEANVRNGFLALSVVNPVNEKVIVKNNRVKTSKSDARNHGIGLRNVERTAEKYNGQLLLSCDEKEFSADVSLKLKHPDEKENEE